MLKTKLLLALCLSFATVAALADAELWSSSFSFSGKEIKADEPLLLKTTDKIAYSSILAEGEPQSIVIDVKDINDPLINATLFSNTSGQPVQGSFAWDYTKPQYDDFNQFSTYVITETVTSDKGAKAYPRTINLVPEPAALLLLGLAGAFFLRRRVRSLMVVLAFVAIASFNANAYCYVTKVDCLQLFPFDRGVVIDYVVEADEAEYFDIQFFGTLDDGETVFDLSETGKLTKDGADGLLIGPGTHKTVWTPDESFYDVEEGNMKIKVKVRERDGLPAFMVYDLESGKTVYIDEIPSGEWTEEYKTTKMVFAAVPAGTFTMGTPAGEVGRQGREDQHEVTLTKPFYMGVFQVTQKQFELITGFNPSLYKGDPRPVEQVSYDLIRGAEKGAEWPTGKDVDENSFLGVFRAQTGKAYDLPTDAQWEYACRANTTTALNTGKDLSDESVCPEMDEAGRYMNNCMDEKGDKLYLQHTTVGCYLPNNWGLYDMHGNVTELCRDWMQARLGTEPVVDPVGPATGESRVVRGGNFYGEALDCRSGARTMSAQPDAVSYGMGFRLILEM